MKRYIREIILTVGSFFRCIYDIIFSLCRTIRNHFVKILAILAGLSLGTLIVLPIFLSVTSNVISEWVRQYVPWLYPTPLVPTREINIPLSKQNACELGRIEMIFRGELYKDLSIEGEASRLVLCAEGSVSANEDHIFTKFAKRFPECLRYNENDRLLFMPTDSPSICRAPYSFIGTKPRRTSLERGLNLCIPGHQFAAVTNPSRQSLRECPDDVLRKYGFK